MIILIIFRNNYNNNYYDNYNYNNNSNNYKINITQAKIIENEIQFIKESDNITCNKSNYKMICIKDDILLLWENNLYLSEEKE